MSAELPRSPSVYLSMFVGGSLAAAWLGARPTDFLTAICVGTASCASLLLYLNGTNFNAMMASYTRRRILVDARLEALKPPVAPKSGRDPA